MCILVLPGVQATDCQWLDITGLDPGPYTLVMTVNTPAADGSRDYEELNYENNVCRPRPPPLPSLRFLFVVHSHFDD